MHDELFFQPAVQPVVVLVASAHTSTCAGGDDAVGSEALHSSELLFLLRVPHLDVVRSGAGLPHRQVVWSE